MPFLMLSANLSASIDSGRIGIPGWLRTIEHIAFCLPALSDSSAHLPVIMRAV